MITNHLPAWAYGDRPVLLVHGSLGVRALFAGAFGVDLVVARSIAELGSLLRHGWDGEVAFVGSHLRPGEAGGLTAMRLLTLERPTVRLVTYTHAYENGNAMFAAAAYQWLGASGLIDGFQHDPDDLPRVARTVAAGGQVATEPWGGRLRHSRLIDAVLANPSWIQIWQAMDESAGEMQRVGAILGVAPSQLRGFKDRATDAASEFRLRFGVASHSGSNRNKKGVLAAFAAENRQFLATPGLSEAMWASPEVRARAADPRETHVLKDLCDLPIQRAGCGELCTFVGSGGTRLPG